MDTRLRLLRNRIGLRQIDMADLLGIKQNAYSNIENGKTSLTERNANIISEKLGVDKDWLIGKKNIEDLDMNPVWDILSPHFKPINPIEEAPIKQRILLYLKHKDISNNDFVKDLHLSKDFWIIPRNPSSDVLVKVCSAHPELSPEWLLTGEGSMLKPVEPVESESANSTEAVKVTDKPKGAPYYNVDFVGGFDLVFNDQTVNPEYYIDCKPYNREGVLWCNITGHSMEPEIHHGDMIALREIKDWKDFIVYGEIYAIVTKNDLRTVKTIRRGSSEDKYLLVPVNTDYDEQEIKKEDVSRMFEVLGSIKRF